MCGGGENNRTTVNWREDGESVKVNGRVWGWNGGRRRPGRVHVRAGDGGGTERHWKRIRGNICERYGCTCQRAALCKNNLSNYEERLLALLSGMLSCRRRRRTAHFPSSLHTYIRLLYMFRCRHILPMIMWFCKIDWNCSLSFIKTDRSVNIPGLANSPRCIWLSIPPAKEKKVFNASLRMYGLRCFHYPFNSL